MPSLFDAGFFSGSARLLLGAFKEDLIDSDRIDNIFGLMFSMALKDDVLSLKYLLALLPNKITDEDYNYSYVKGALGLISKETDFEKDIRFVLKKVDLADSLAVNLVHLVSSVLKKDYYSPAYRICEKHWSKSKLIASLVSTVKGDVGNLTQIAKMIKVDIHSLSLLLSCAKKRLDLLPENFKFISSALSIHSINFTRFIVSVAWGDISAIEDLRPYLKIQASSHPGSIEINKTNRKLINCLFVLNGHGSKLQYEYIPKLDKSLANNFKIIEMIACEKLGVDYEEVENKDVFNIKKLIRAWWNDEESTNILTEMFKKYLELDISPVEHEQLKKIYHYFPNKLTEVIRISLKKVYESAVKSVKSSYQMIKTASVKYTEALQDLKDDIEVNKTFRELERSGEHFSIKVSEGSEEGILKTVTIKENTLKLIDKVGCTVSTGQLRRFMGYYLTKIEEDNSETTSCIFCATHCCKNSVFIVKSSSPTWSICECRSKQYLKQKEFSIFYNQLEVDLEFSSDDNDDKLKTISQCPKINLQNFSKVKFEEDLTIKDNFTDKKESVLRKRDYVDQQIEKDFEKSMDIYLTSTFLEDLIIILGSELDTNLFGSPKKLKSELTWYDPSLQRDVHFIEHIILLAHGYCRPGLVEFLTTFLMKNIFTSIISLQQGDFESFSASAHCWDKIEENDTESMKKAIMVLMLVRGEPDYCKIHSLSGASGCYNSLFKTIWGNLNLSSNVIFIIGKNCIYQPAKTLHAMWWRKDIKLMGLIKKVSIASIAEKESWDYSSIDFQINRLLTETLHMDSNSVTWFSVLSCIALGDFRSIKFIWAKLEIPKSKMNLYKAICSKDYLTVLTLLRELPTGRFDRLWEVVRDISNQNIESVALLICKE
jgi:hypothetical protein